MKLAVLIIGNGVSPCHMPRASMHIEHIMLSSSLTSQISKEVLSQGRLIRKCWQRSKLAAAHLSLPAPSHNSLQQACHTSFELQPAQQQS